MTDLQTCGGTTSKIRSEMENYVNEVSTSRGDDDVRSSANSLTGTGLSDDASKTVDTVSKARTTFANRLASHRNRTYNATNQLKTAGGTVTAYTPKSGHNRPVSDTVNSFGIPSQQFKWFTLSEDPVVMFNDLLSQSGTDLFRASDTLVVTSHKYEQVNAGLKQDRLGDGLSGKTFEAEAKARRILTNDTEDLQTGLEKTDSDLKDASATVNMIKNSASSTQSSISAAELKIRDDNTVTVKNRQSGASASTSIISYQNEIDRLVGQAGDTVTFIPSVYAEIAKLGDTANSPSPEVVNHGERPPNPN